MTRGIWGQTRRMGLLPQSRKKCGVKSWNDAYPFVRIHHASGLGFVLHSGKEGHAVATDTAAEFFNCHEKACKTLP